MKALFMNQVPFPYLAAALKMILSDNGLLSSTPVQADLSGVNLVKAEEFLQSISVDQFEEFVVGDQDHPNVPRNPGYDDADKFLNSVFRGLEEKQL